VETRFIISRSVSFSGVAGRNRLTACNAAENIWKQAAADSQNVYRLSIGQDNVALFDIILLFGGFLYQHDKRLYSRAETQPTKAHRTPFNASRRS
jgi:hypothetical protein